MSKEVVDEVELLLAAFPEEVVDMKYRHKIVKVFCAKCVKDNLHVSKAQINVSKKRKYSKVKILCAKCISDSEKEAKDFRGYIDLDKYYDINKTDGEEIKAPICVNEGEQESLMKEFEFLKLRSELKI